MDDAAQHIATQLIRAEQMLCTRLCKRRHRVVGSRALRRDHIGKDRD